MTHMIVDSFAGGGGANAGIEMALGRSPDLAINHDAEAIAMHAANHPNTRHLNSNIFTIDPQDYARRGEVLALWASPDCKHFSKAKGGAPVMRNIRDLAWVVVSWAERVRPNVIFLENVEEFQTWGPVDVSTNQPIKERSGETFNKWIRRLRQLGYKVESRELRACDYGVPTIRKRLFLIARCDGEQIVWPEPSHGKPGSPDVESGKLKPWVSAASIIDWSIPCPSIFLTPKEAAPLNVRRPLAENTLRRIARGVKRYILDAADPFIVSVANSGTTGRAPYHWGPEEPLRTVTTSNGFAAVVPGFVTYAQHGGNNRSAADPLHTVCANTKDYNGLVVPHLSAYYGEGNGGLDRSADIADPVKTVTTENRHALVAGFLAQHNTGVTGHDARKPLSTITQTGTQQAVMAAHLMPHYGNSLASDPTKPVPTVTAGGGGKQALVASHMINMHGSDRRASSIGEPVRTITAGGEHAGMVAAFLTKYYGQDQTPELTDPLHTVRTKACHGLVVVPISGVDYILADIGMRMLTPRELYRAQGFPDSYQIDQDADGRRFTKAAQIRMCGNSVAPAMAAALVRANLPEHATRRDAA